MTGRVEAVLFDLDETLIDAQMGLHKAHERIAELVSRFLVDNGIQTDLALLTTKMKLLDDRMNRERIYDRDLWWPILVVDIQPSPRLPKNLIHRLTIDYWNTYSEFSLPYPDTVTTLTYLKQCEYRLGLVSDTDGIPGLKSSRINRLPFREFFSAVVVAGEDTSELKPNPAPFLKASNILGISSEATVFVGDKPFTDIAGAKEAGMMTVRVWRREWKSTIKADLTVKSLKDLLTIL